MRTKPSRAEPVGERVCRECGAINSYGSEKHRYDCSIGAGVRLRLYLATDPTLSRLQYNREWEENVRRIREEEAERPHHRSFV